MGLLAPVVVGLVLSLRRRVCWLAGGAWLVLFAGTVALPFNVRHSQRGGVADAHIATVMLSKGTE